MLKWFSNDESSPALGAPVSQEGSSSQSLAEVTDQLAQMEQLVTQLKELIREKDDILRTKDEQLKAENEVCESKLSKMRLQNRAKVISLNSQLDDLKNRLSLSGGKENKSVNTKSGGDGDQEHAAASRGKILLLKKKVDELEQHLSQREVELGVKTKELEAQRQRGLEVDAMLVEKDKQLLEKEAYIVDLHMSTAGDFTPRALPKPAEEQKLQVQSAKENSSLEDLQLLVQNLTKKVGDSEEKYSLLQEQTECLKELLVKEKTQFEEKENMYKQNIQTFKDIILQKDNMLIENNQRHEQELFKMAAKSDASADLEQLLKALKQKLHEKEEVLMGKTQVIDVLQGEVDARDQQIKELVEKRKRLQGEKDNMQSKLDAEKHVMRAQLWDLMQKHETELRGMAEKHESELSEKDQEHLRQVEELRRTQAIPQEKGVPMVPAPDSTTDTATAQKLLELEAQARLKAEEASKSEAKFLKTKAWSKSRIKQLEDELKKSQSGKVSPDVNALRSQITDLVEEREEMLCTLEHYDELKIKNEQLIAKLVVYEEQQRKMQADLEQVTKRAASQTSESGSADDLQIQEWQEIVVEAESARDQAQAETTAMALRMSHIEEEREALASRQQELEEELAQAQGLRQQRGKKLRETATRSLQEDFEFDGKSSYQDPKCTLESTSMDGENMGGWWPEYSTPDTGLRSVVGELELERNQLQEQILGLEERCQDLEDRLQLQARIESLQNETERLLGQLASLRNQQSRDAEKHQLLIASLNKQLKGLSETQECLEKSLIEKDNSIAKTSEKLELIENLQESLKEKEIQHREVSEKLLQTEHNLTEVDKKFNTSEKQCSELRTSVAEITQKLNILKEKRHKQEATIVSLQSDLEQTNDELYKLNSTHLEERAQLIHDLQSCEREIDNLKDTLSDKDKEISALSNIIMEHTEQLLVLKREIKNKEDALVHVETALNRAEQEALIIKDSQSSDQQTLNTKITDLVEQLKTSECKLSEAKEQEELKKREVDDLIIQVQEDNLTIQALRVEIQKLNVNYGNNLSECESQISSQKGQVTASPHKVKESETLLSQLEESNATNEKLQNQLQVIERMYENELKSFKEERNKLLAEVTKHKEELQALSKPLEEHVEGQEQVKNVVQEKQKTISLLEQKLNVTQEEAESERLKLNQKLKARGSEIERLTKELQGKSEKLSDLEINVKTLESTNQQQQTVVESNAIELTKQKQLVADLSEKAAITHEETVILHSQVNKLTEESKKLGQEIADGKRSQSELMEENNTMQSKISAFEVQNSENHKIIEGLLKEKEELTVRTEELSNVLEQNRSTISENLLEKTNECSQLTKLLLESKESVAHLQEKVNILNSQVEQLQCCVAEEKKMVVDQNANCEKQESQIRQLQENLSLLQEQSTALKSGLMGKDTTLQQMSSKCSSLQNEILQQKESFSHLQSETEACRNECTKLNQCLEEKEVTLRNKTQECQNYINELSKTSQCVDSLRSQLGVMCENAVKLESARADLKVSLENHIVINNKLNEQNNLRQSEVVRLQNHIQALREENQKLQRALESQEKELTGQRLLMEDCGRKTDVTLEENVNLKAHVIKLLEQIQTLQQEITDKDRSQSELMEENNAMQSKITAFEVQHSENHKIIEGLLKEKEELNVRTEELSNVLEQNRSTISENLLEKTNECSQLTKLLLESKESVAHLQEKVNILNSQVEQLQCCVAEEKKMVVDQNANCEKQESQIRQLQENLSLLQEQSTALKSGLMGKDSTLQQMTSKCSSLQNEILQQKESFSHLQSETEACRNECTKLNQCLEEKEVTLRNKTQECQNYINELSKTSQCVDSLCSQLGEMRENAVKLESAHADLKVSLENHIVNNNKLNEQNNLRQSEVVHLQNHIQALREENQKLQRALESQEKELTGQRLLMEDCGRKTDVTLEENVNLKAHVIKLLEQIQTLQQEITDKDRSQSKVVDERNKIQSKISAYDVQRSEDFKIIEGLLKEKEELTLRTEEIRNVFEQNNSISESLLEKTNECCHLSKLLTESKEVGTHLQQQVKFLNSQMDQLQCSVSDKEKTISDQNALYEMQQSQLSQLQETLSLLQEQSTALKSELMKKDGTLQQTTAMCTSMENETLQQKQLLTQLQSESVSLIGKCTSLSQSLEEKEATLRKKTQECQNQFDELKRSSELVVSLRSQLGVMNGNTIKLESENGNLKTCLANEVAESGKLREEVAHRQAEIVDLKNYIQVLNEENRKIKIEDQNLATEVTQKLGVLQSELSNKNNNVVSLTECLAAVNLERESLQMALQQKTESLNQQEIFIKQFQAKSVEGKDELNQKMETIIELQTQVKCMQNSLQHKERSLKNKENELKQLKDESAVVLKTQSDANTGVITNLQGQLQIMLQKNDQLTVRIAEKESEMQQKVNDCERLRAQFSELEDSVLQLRNQVEALTSESIRLMEMVKEKEAVVEIQSRSLAHSEMMKVTCKAKVEECDSLKDQLIERQETMSKLSDDLSARSFEIAKLKEALEEKEVRILDQIKVLHDLQEKVDEAALFKAQLMESTELVSQLQGQVQELSSKFEKVCKTGEEKQSAFLNLQEKYAVHLEELHDVKMQLSQRNEERANLNRALSDCNDAVKTAESTTDSLRNEATLLQDKLQHIQASNAKLSKQNKDALATHQTKTASMIAEIERLKLQHMQVSTEVNALTENLEQRELALHTINNQYSAQVKHAEYLVAEIQKRDEQNKKLKEECSLATQYFEKQLGLSISENEHLQQEVKKTIAEKEELVRRYNNQLQAMHKKLNFENQQHLGNMNETVEKLKTEKEHLQVQLKEVGKLTTENAQLTQKKIDQHTGKDVDKNEAGLAKQRLAEAKQHLDSSRQEVSQLSQTLAEERARREAAEEALSLAEGRAKSIDTKVSKTNPREFSIQLESDDEREALIIDPNEHIVMRNVKGGVLSCRRWLRGRRLYCSKLLTSQAKPRYLFLTYILALHMVVFMCLAGTL